jgi:hypothetical protein
VDGKNWSSLPRLQGKQQQQLRMLTLLQQAAATSLMTSQKQHSPPPPPPAPLSAIDFWGEVTRLGAQYRFGEWVKVAELVMVMVPGSVEDERMFSTFNTSVNSSATGYKRGT